MEGDLRLVDSESDAAIEITADYDVIQRYRDRLAVWQEHLRKTCASLGAAYVSVETTLPLEKLVLATLQKVRVLS